MLICVYNPRTWGWGGRQEDEEHKVILYLSSLLSWKNLMGERASPAARSTCYERHCGNRIWHSDRAGHLTSFSGSAREQAYTSHKHKQHTNQTHILKSLTVFYYRLDLGTYNVPIMLILRSCGHMASLAHSNSRGTQKR